MFYMVYEFFANRLFRFDTSTCLTDRQMSTARACVCIRPSCQTVTIFFNCEVSSTFPQNQVNFGPQTA